VDLDVVRGFAVFGVLLAYTLWNLGSPPEETYGPADRILNRVLSVLVDGKLFSLFTFLFGLGFSIQLSRAAARGVSVVPVYRRRLLVLLVIGLAHALLLRNGDILVPYAVLGFALLALRNASNRTLAIVAMVSLLYPYLARGAWQLLDMPLLERPETEGMSHLAANYVWLRYWYANAVFSWPGMLPLFLFGLYFGRRPLRDRIGGPQRGLWRTLVVCLGITLLGLVARGFLTRRWSDSPLLIGQHATLGLLWTMHAWSLAAVYALSLVLLLRRPSSRRWLAPLAAVGRMALTNYLLQAALIVPVCLALDLFDRITPSLGILLALAVALLQVPASVWWLRRFRFGPAEWIWRSLTYGHPQPMRAAGNRAVAAGV